MKNHPAIILVMVLVLAFATSADEWAFDKAHSTVGFSVSHMLISSVEGKFGEYDGKVIFDGKDITKGSVEITIPVASVNTDNEKRDSHLKTSDFFDAEKYPNITFKSTKIVKTGNKAFTMTGDLKMKGVTKSVTLDCNLNGVITDPWGNTRAGFSAEGKINRHDFNVAWDNKLQDGSFIVGEEVSINLHIELTKVEHK